MNLFPTEDLRDREEEVKDLSELPKRNGYIERCKVDIGGYVISQEGIKKGVEKAAKGITDYLDNKDIKEEQDIYFVPVANGALPFFKDLVFSEHLDYGPQWQITDTNSYSNNSQQGKTDVYVPDNFDSGKDILCVIEDLLDTGQSMEALIEYMEGKYNPSDLQVIPFLDKRGRTEVEIPQASPVYTVGPHWVFGYGMDSEGYGRGLPFVAVKEE